MTSIMQNTVTLIIGGSAGIGKGAAKAIVAAGGSVWIVGRTASKLDQAKAEILALYPDGPDDRVRTSVLDAMNENDVKQFFSKDIEKGSIHHLVITVGASAKCSDIRGDEGYAGLKKQFDLKFFAQLLPVSIGAESLADDGSIVLTSGGLAKRPGKGSSALCAANAALDAIVKGLANDFGPRLRVNCVSPGLTDTEMWTGMPAEVKQNMLKGFSELVPTKRYCTSEDVGKGILFLLESPVVTGFVLDVDAGYVVRP